MGKRVRISNDSLNSYGFRVLTSGLDVAQYNRNPVLLYMHERGNVVGYVKDLKVENNEVTGELMFDCASELSQRCKKQFEFGSLRMVSAGLEILETSEDKDLLVAGQTRPTITKSKLFEVSIADVGANDDALVLQRNGKMITLGRDGDCDLPLLNNNNKQKKTEEMENKTIALQLGLPETATDAEISAKLTELNALKEQNVSLLKEKESLTLVNITNLVTQAIAEKRLEEKDKDQFVELGKKIGAEELEKTLKAMHPAVKLSSVLGHQGGASAGEQKFTKLSEVPADQIAVLRSENPEEYKRLYKAEYGIDCEI
nr:MAG TPA: prohead serine protease [Caudoviricetes sp.]